MNIIIEIQKIELLLNLLGFQKKLIGSIIYISRKTTTSIDKIGYVNDDNYLIGDLGLNLMIYHNLIKLTKDLCFNKYKNNYPCTPSIKHLTNTVKIKIPDYILTQVELEYI